MGCDTRIILRGHIKAHEIENMLNKLGQFTWCDITKSEPEFDLNEVHFYKGGDDKPYDEFGFIAFQYKEETRKLFYSHQNYEFKEDIINDDEGFREIETTRLSLGYFGKSVEIAVLLASEFGGWVQFNDCSDDEWIKVNGKEM